MSKPKTNNKLSSATVGTTALPADESNPSVELRQESLRWLLAILSSLLVYWIVARIVVSVYHPDVNVLIEEAQKMFIEPGSVRPEPVEALLFRLGIIVIVPCLLVAYSVLSRKKWLNSLARDPVYLFVSVCCVLGLAALIYADFAAPNPFGALAGDTPQNARDLISDTNFSFYFESIFVGKYVFLYLALIVPAIAALFFIGFKKYNWQQHRLFRIGSSVFGYALIGWAILAIVLMNIYKFPYTNENKIDFNAVYASMTQVYAGVPMLVNGFTNTYGLYPHFLNPLFQMTGLSILKFSLVMSIMLGIGFLLNLYFLRRFVTNNVILFLGFSTVIFFPYLDFRLLTIFDSVFSLFPIRYIIGCVLLALSTLYFKSGSKTLYWITFSVMAMFILWNPEFGIVNYLSWVAVNMYHDFYADDGKPDIKRVLYHLAVAVAMVLIVFYGYKLIIFLSYGSWPDLALLFGPMLYFGKYGFNNLPMALVHPWNLSVLIMICGFLYALVHMYKKTITQKSTAVLVVSLIGLGYFFYFQARSQDSNYSLSSSFVLVLLTILGDELWSVVRRTNVLLLNGLFVIFLLIVSFSFVEIIYNSDILAAMISQEYDKDKQLPEQKRYDGNLSFILANSKPREKIFVFSPKKRQALFYGNGKRIMGFNPSLIDMFQNTELAGFEHTIRDSAFKIFIEPLPGIYSFLTRPLAAFGSSYEFTSYNETMGLFSKRQTPIPAATFFTDSGQVILHHKYADDTSGRALRIADAQGLKPVKLNPEFSVSVLFYPTFQIFETAALVGNAADTSGFMIGNILNTSKYFFGIDKVVAAVKLPYKEWSYCVMNVYPDRFVVYRNGDLIISRPLPHPIYPSANKLYVGNISGVHYYVGAIAEVAVQNKVMDTTLIRHTWEEIQRSVKK